MRHENRDLSIYMQMLNQNECVGQLGLVCKAASKLIVLGSFGTEFFIGIPPQFQGSGSYSDNLESITISIASKAEGHVRTYIPHKWIDRNEVLKKGITNITIVDMPVHKIGLKKTGIFLKTTVPVAVYVTQSSITYLAFPQSFLGKHYIAPKYSSNHTASLGTAYVAFVGTYDGTIINVTESNRSFTIRLENLNVYVLNHRDMVQIISNKPVAVLTAVECTNQRHRGTMGCRSLVSQLLSDDKFARQFIVPSLPGDSNPYAHGHTNATFLITVTTSTASSISFKSVDRTVNIHLNNAGSAHAVFNDTPVMVYSGSPASVIRYVLADDMNIESMMIVPGVENYLNDYFFPSLKSQSLYIVGNSFGDIRLNEHQVIGVYTHTWFPMPSDVDWSILGSWTSSGLQELSQLGSSLTGLSAFIDGAVAVGIGSPYISHFGSPDTCFACEDLSHLELCDSVKRCNQGEVCFVSKYVKSGQITFRSGCIAQDTCEKQERDSLQSDSLCTRCCYKNFCNSQGCGDAGLRVPSERGPLCFDCQHVRTPSECLTLTLCPQHEACSIDKYQWGDHFHYKMGCSQCQRYRRSAPVCHMCCANDYCNSNCTQSTNGHLYPGIVG